MLIHYGIIVFDQIGKLLKFRCVRVFVVIIIFNIISVKILVKPFKIAIVGNVVYTTLRKQFPEKEIVKRVHHFLGIGQILFRKQRILYRIVVVENHALAVIALVDVRKQYIKIVAAFKYGANGIPQPFEKTRHRIGIFHLAKPVFGKLVSHAFFQRIGLVYVHAIKGCGLRVQCRALGICQIRVHDRVKGFVESRSFRRLFIYFNGSTGKLSHGLVVNDVL